MRKIYSLAMALWLACLSAQASAFLDSIGVENYKGKKLVLYKVDPKDTYYSIAKKYQVNYKDLMSFNDNKKLNIGIIIKVPTKVPYVRFKPKNNKAVVQKNSVFEYEVKKKDNLIAIAKRFNTTVEDIKKLNGSHGVNLQIGQKLKIKGINHHKETVNDNAPSAVLKPNLSTSSSDSYINYTVKKKDNLNFIAKNYNTTVEAIKALNGLSSNNLKIGQILKVPLTEPSAGQNVVWQNPNKIASALSKESASPEKNNESEKNNEKVKDEAAKENMITHIVAENENIYSIAEKYGVTTYQITTVNKLENNNLSVGQKLLIPDKKPIEILEPEKDEEEEENEGDSTLVTQNLRMPAQRYGLNQAEEKGTAVVLIEADLDSSKMLALHRTASVGKIIKITNPTTGRSTFAKVVGKFIDNQETKDALLVITKSVADAVGALDKKFFCTITYSP